MHFSIPSTEECNGQGGTYTGFHIHINGEYHCTVRYKQLYNLCEQLKRISEDENFPPFPSKKYWPLTPNQLEERRSQLEKYIQAVGQSYSTPCKELFNGFLLAAQQESTGERARGVSIDVFLLNGFKITVNANSNDRSNSVLENACSQINLPSVYVYYFSLFLIKKEENGELSIIRKLQDFESPYLTQKNISENLKIMIRKSYWDPGYDLELMHDKYALNLLYVQTVSDIKRGWILCNKETSEQLATLQSRGAKREYLELARTLKYYGYIQFKECICDYPTPDSKVIVSAGQRELNLRIEAAGGEIKERAFKVTRMRCWRIITHNDIIETDEETVLQRDPQLDLSFEYLIAKDNLQWITITSEQAILMAVCLQSIVDELLLKKSSANFKQPKDYHYGSFSYMKRDGSSEPTNLSKSISSSLDPVTSPQNGTPRSPSRTEPTMSMKRLSEKLSNLKNKQRPQPLVENDAFEGIGDEDL
ncbi:sorting nexin-17 [Cimex lectularius]|uniref:PX domain-containing protein n=1 Tax=Cimex lectularius TaxID=79782 RepID=A0A8I6RYU7_CIMLE|nr:sorting nexin-17 [Cimex lectularius]